MHLLLVELFGMGMEFASHFLLICRRHGRTSRRVILAFACSITPFVRKGMIRKARGPVKVLAQGDLTKALTVRVDAVSAAAAEKIRAAGGTTT